MEDRKRKIGIIAASSVVLVAMAVILVVACTGGNDEKQPEVSASQRAIMSICDTTEYQQTCLDSLAGHNSSDPKALIEVAIQASINHIKRAIKNSTVIHDTENTPRGRLALETCRELANRAVDDLNRSYGTFDDFDITSVADIPLELKIWLSSSITQLETCLDSFEDVPGDAGNIMRQVLKESMEMTSNVLTMVAEISTFLDSIGGGGGTQSVVTSRRLLSTDESLPEWVDSGKRKLLTGTPQVVTPDLIIAKDGTGNYLTINEALKNIPKSGKNKTIVLYIKEGVYEEKVQFNSSMKNLFVIGDGPTKTRITGKSNFIDGTNTYQTATVAVQGDDFIARDIGFENAAGPEKHQAVALRVSADKAIFYNCHMDAYQDTLYAHTYRQFYRNCRISGTIDFIFGDSAAVFQNCTLLVRKPLENQQCVVMAQGRKEIRQPTGFILQNCSIRPDRDLYDIRKNIKTYLGRPWKQYSRTVIMESFLDDLISPTGWLPWNGTFALNTLFYTEFNNRGPAAPKKQRAKWPGVKELPSSRIQRFTAVEFLDGNGWIPHTQVPYTPGFVFPVPKDDPNVKYSPIVPEETKDLGPKVEQMKHLSPPKDGKQNASPSNNANVPRSGSTGAPSTTGSTTTSTPPSNTAAPPPPIPPSASTVVIIEKNVTALKTAASSPPIGGSNASRVPSGGNHLASPPMHTPNSLGSNSNETMMAATPNFKPDAPKGDTTHAAKISASAPNAAVFKPGSSESDGVSSAPTTSLIGSSAPPPMTSTDDGFAAPPPQAHKSAPSQSSSHKDFASSPSNVDVTAPPPTSFSGGSTSQLPQSGNIIAKASPPGASPSPASADSTTPPPPSSISSRSSSQSPPTISPSGRPTPSSPESDTTAPPPNSQGTAASTPPPPASEASTPPSNSKDKGSDASPPRSEAATPPSKSKDKASAPLPPQSEATTPPSNSKDKASAPSPPQSEATTLPSNSKDKASAPSPPQSEATTLPSNTKDKASAPSPPQSEATTPPSNSQGEVFVPPPSQSEATTPPSDSQDEVFVTPPPPSQSTSPPSIRAPRVPSPPLSQASSPLPTPPNGGKTQSLPPSYSLHVVSSPSKTGGNSEAQSTQSDTSSPPPPTSQPQSDTSPLPTSSSSGSIPSSPPSDAATPPTVNSTSSTQSM